MSQGMSLVNRIVSYMSSAGQMFTSAIHDNEKLEVQIRGTDLKENTSLNNAHCQDRDRKARNNTEAY
jgi:hypothetical protein